MDWIDQRGKSGGKRLGRGWEEEKIRGQVRKEAAVLDEIQ